MKLRMMMAAAWMSVLAISHLAAQSLAASQTTTRAIKPGMDDPKSELLKVGISRLGPDGRVYVVETAHMDIRVYDPSGRFVANVGRNGAGPGEFRRIQDFGWIGDTLWVSDPGLRRFTLFDKGYAPVATFGWGVPGTHLGDVLTIAGRYAQFAPSNPAIANAPVVRVTRTGQTQDTLAVLPYRNLLAQLTAEVAGKPKTMMLLQPFPDDALWDVDPSGRWLAILDRSAPTGPASTGASLTLHDLRAHTSRQVVVPYAPALIAPSVTDSVFQLYKGVSETALRSALFLPDYWPIARSLVVSDDGAVWLERQGDFPVGTWTRIGVGGKVTGVVRLPAGYRIFDARGNDILATIGAPDDAQAPVIIYTIRG